MDLKHEIMEEVEKAQLSAEEILRKYDKESDKRELIRQKGINRCMEHDYQRDLYCVLYFPGLYGGFWRA